MAAKQPRKKKAENSVFSVFTGTANFSPSDTQRILEIGTAQSSAMRKAYRFKQKNPEATVKETAESVLPNFEGNLNRFYYRKNGGAHSPLSRKPAEPAAPKRCRKDASPTTTGLPLTSELAEVL